MPTDDKFEQVKHDSRPSSQDGESIAEIDPAFERATIRKIDLRLLLILGGLCKSLESTRELSFKF
jgi:hypothetical protein